MGVETSDNGVKKYKLEISYDGGVVVLHGDGRIVRFDINHGLFGLASGIGPVLNEKTPKDQIQQIIGYLPELVQKQILDYLALNGG